MDGVTLLGVSGLTNLILSLACIAFCWWVLMGVRIDQVVRQGKIWHARMLMIVLSIVLGHGVATFLIDYLQWSRMVGQLFG